MQICIFQLLYEKYTPQLILHCYAVVRSYFFLQLILQQLACQTKVSDFVVHGKTDMPHALD